MPSHLPGGTAVWVLWAAVAVLALILVAIAIGWQRRRLARRFARRVSPWSKPPVIVGQVVEPEEWQRRR